MNYYPFHIGDYLRDTAHLSVMEDGAYRRMLDLYYASEKPLPLDLVWLCRLLRAESDEEKEAVQFVLQHFFEKFEHGWVSKRAEAEIKAANKRTKAARLNGKKGGRPKTQRVSTGLATQNPAETQGKAPNNQKPITKNQKPKIEEVALRLPDWLPSDAWKAFLEMRKQKKTPNTPRALNMLLTELTRLKGMGHDPAKVLDQSTLKGWKDVYALKPELVAVSSEPKTQLCDYCSKPSTGAVNGRRSCSEHWQLAMDNERPALKVAL